MSPPYPAPGYPERPSSGGPHYGDRPGYESYAGQPDNPDYSSASGYGTFPPGYGGSQPPYPRHGYGEPEYGGNASVGQPGYSSHGSYLQPEYGGQPEFGGYGSYGQPGFGGYSQPGHAQPGYEPRYGGAPPTYGPTIPAQSYPIHDTAPAYGYADGRERPVAPPRPLDTPRAKPRRRILPIVLALVVVLLLCGSGAGYAVTRPYLAEWPATLSTPQEVAGLELSNEPELQRAAEDIAAGIRKDVKVDRAIAAFYQDPAVAERIVALVGGTALLLNPKAELDAAFRGAAADGLKIENIKDIDAGRLGGFVRCGSAEQVASNGRKVPLSVCAWADHGSLVIGLFFNRPVDESAALLLQIRTEILKR